MIIELPAVDPEQQAQGARVRAVREARGLSLEALASALDLAPTDLARAERGRRRLTASELHRASLALHVPMWLLFADADVSKLRRI
jgi:transcriptional regulator with XRE-family HTH domain